MDIYIVIIMVVTSSPIEWDQDTPSKPLVLVDLAIVPKLLLLQACVVSLWQLRLSARGHEVVRSKPVRTEKAHTETGGGQNMKK